MERTDQGLGTAGGPEGGSGNNVEIRGDAGGAVIAGNYNVVVDARHGAVVNLVTPGERPNPVRRDNVRLLPRAQREPLGRSAELASVATAAHAGGLIQLWGPAGIGKSALLRHAARTLPPGPDGVLYLSAAHRDVGDLAQEIFEGCYDCVGYAPSAPELRRLMAGVRVRVYVDNAELTEEQLRELADAIPDATFVFAGRNRSLLGDGTAVEVRGIDRAAGIELLARSAGSRVWDNMTAAGELWQAADGRPLLLLRAAALIRLDAAGAAVFPRPRDVEGVVPLLLDRLDARTSGVLRLLAMLGDAEVAPVHIGVLMGEDDPAELCGRLVELGLAEGSERGFRCAPDVVARLRRRDTPSFPVDRLCAHFVAWLSDPATTPAEVADHARALEVVAELAENAGESASAVEILRAASPMMARSLRFGVWGRLLGRGWTAARNSGDPRAMAYFTHEEGVRSLLTGRRVIATVLMAEAAVLWREFGADGAGGGAAGQTVPPPAQPGPADTFGTGPDGAANGWDTGLDAGTPTEQVATHMTELAEAASFPGTCLPPLTPTAPMGPGPSASDPTAPTFTASGPSDPGPGMSGAADPGTSSGAWQFPGPSSGGASSGGASSGGASSGGASTGGASSGGASTGATAGGTAAGAGAVAGSSAIGSVLGWLALMAALIGGVAWFNDMREEEANKAPEISLPSSATGLALGKTSLAGSWADTQGNTYHFTQQGPGTYRWTGRNPCGETIQVTMRGTGGTYTGSQPLYDISSGSCDSTLGQIETTITVARDGKSARLEGEPSDSSLPMRVCPACGTQSLTRVSGP